MTGGFLIVRRDGALWGLAAEHVSGIAQIERGERSARVEPGAEVGQKPPTSSAARGLEVRFKGGRRLAVDAVLTLAGELRIRPLSLRLSHYLPRGSSGLAMFAGEPVVLMARESEVPRV